MGNAKLYNKIHLFYNIYYIKLSFKNHTEIIL